MKVLDTIAEPVACKGVNCKGIIARRSTEQLSISLRLYFPPTVTLGPSLPDHLYAASDPAPDPPIPHAVSKTNIFQTLQQANFNLCAKSTRRCKHPMHWNALPCRLDSTFFSDDAHLDNDAPRSARSTLPSSSLGLHKVGKAVPTEGEVASRLLHPMLEFVHFQAANDHPRICIPSTTQYSHKTMPVRCPHSAHTVPVQCPLEIYTVPAHS